MKAFTYAPSKKRARQTKKRGSCFFLKKSLSKMNLCKEYVCDFFVLCTKYA